MDGVMIVSMATAILLGAYVLMCLILFIKGKDAYRHADRLPLKEDETPITPRTTEQHHERAKP